MRQESQLYDYQDKMTSLFLGEEDGKPMDLIVQAPTGAGKTLGALFPGVAGLTSGAIQYHPQKIIYGIPMRVLANSFEKKYGAYSGVFRDWDSAWNARIQTGERPEDTLFEGKLIFATVDQMLASFLNIPYGIPKRLDNINAGAFIGSYLVFDEFHLYPSSEMMLSVLAMLYLLKDITRFTLMTATFSRSMLDAIANLLEAAIIADEPGIPVNEGLFKDIPHLGKQYRTWQAAAVPLTGQDILRQLTEHRTVLCVVNRVDRAQQIYQELMAHLPKESDTDVMLLHARFYKAHRTVKEEEAQRWLGKEDADNLVDDGRRKVIIATQVVEVGLDISAEVLLTECAPAASLIQRAGRCARWGGEGRVIVFPPPPDDKTGGMNFLPYTDDGLADVCQRTWDALNSSRFNQTVLRYHDEQALIDAAHTQHDHDHLLSGLKHRVEKRCDELLNCMKSRDAGYISSLIRQNNSVRLYIMADRTGKALTENHYALEGFSVTKGQLIRAFEQMQTTPQIDAPWLIAVGLEDTSAQDEEDTHPTTQYVWQPISGKKEDWKHRLFVAHPEAISYDEDYGLRWVNTGQPAQESGEVEKGRRGAFEIEPDTYVQHIGGLMDAYTRKDDALGFVQPLREMYQYPLLQVATLLHDDITWETIDRYIRLMLALHDVGKLNQDWQAWAQARHRLSMKYLPELADWVPSEGTLLAHTIKGRGRFHTDSEHKGFEAEFKATCRVQKGNHSVEGAEAARDLLWEATQATRQDYFWYGVISAAICHHHTPDARNVQAPFKLVYKGKEAVAAALVRCGFDETEAVNLAEKINPMFTSTSSLLGKGLEQVKPDNYQYHWTLMYYLFVRILRLADQRASRYVERDRKITR